MKKVRLGFLVAFLCMVTLLLTGENVYAKANDKYDDPEYWRAQGNVSEGFYDSVLFRHGQQRPCGKADCRNHR